MTPKEKAKELFDKMYSWQLASVKTYTPSVAIVIAQQSAIIAVEEILNNFGGRVEENIHYCNYSAIQFYEEVKSEIENL